MHEMIRDNRWRKKVSEYTTDEGRPTAKAPRKTHMPVGDPETDPTPMGVGAT